MTHHRWFREVLQLGILAAVLAAGGCATLLSPSLLGVVATKGRPFVIASTEKAHGYGYLSHPYMTQLSDRELIVRYNVGGDTPDPRPKPELVRIAPAYSPDGGQTWQLGLEAVPVAERDNTHHLGLIETTNGCLRYIWEMYPAKANRLVFVGKDGTVESVYSTCQVPETKQPIRLSLHRGVAMDDGRLLVVGHTRFKDDAKYRVIVLQSTNEGRTFEYLATVASESNCPWAAAWPFGFEGPNESSIARVGSNELVCVMRTGQKKNSFWAAAWGTLPMLQARSTDGGRTWTTRELDVPGVYPKLLAMSNGILVLAVGRPGNSLFFSTDRGRTWGRELAITPVDVRTTGYIGLTEVEPGRLLVVYDLFNTSLSKIWLWEPVEVNGVFGVFVTVRRLIQ